MKRVLICQCSAIDLRLGNWSVILESGVLQLFYWHLWLIIIATNNAEGKALLLYLSLCGF